MPASASAQVQDRVSGTEKGSLLIFPKVEVRWNDAGFLLQDTFISLTNDYPGDVDVQMYFVMGDPEEDSDRFHPGVNFEGREYWSDVKIQLTPNQPTYWSALTGLGYPGPAVSPWTVLDPGDLPGRPDPDFPGQRMLRGYIIAFACDAVDGKEIKWDHLAGNGTIVNYLDGYAWEYNAWAFQSAVDGITGDGELHLDGLEYAPCFEYLLMNFQAVGSTAYSAEGIAQVISDTDLTLLTLGIDLRQNFEEVVCTKADFLVWNQWEAQFSGAHRCVCVWDQQFLSLYDSPNHFLKEFLQTDQGKARFKGVESDPNCPGSRDAPLLGVVAKILTFDGGNPSGGYAAAGSNLFGMGFDDTAVIKYEPQGPPPPQGFMNTLLRSR
jgi:hypothetical protein